MALDTILAKVMEKESMNINADKEIEGYLVGALKEVQEQIPVNGVLVILKTPLESATIRRDGLRYDGIGVSSENIGHYSFLSTMGKIGSGIASNKKSDEYTGCLDLLQKIAEQNGFKITGKYFPK
jgi:hypothetical protein